MGTNIAFSPSPRRLPKRIARSADIQHAAGSCRMTGFKDADGVVNPDGTMKGIAGLRVADASIMPSDCRANTHFTTVVIGEAIARMMMR
jgi:choline dehydrogenase-like flavoprotein